MKIEIIVDPRHVAPQALASRVAPATVAAADSGRGRLVPLFRSIYSPADSTAGFFRATRGGRGGRRGGRREAPTKKSAADLDAEMEVSILHQQYQYWDSHCSCVKDYTASNQAAAAPPAAADAATA
jgi:hypothetical protein